MGRTRDPLGERVRPNSFVGEAREKNLELNANEVSVEPVGRQASRAKLGDWCSRSPFSTNPFSRSHAKLGDWRSRSPFLSFQTKKAPRSFRAGCNFSREDEARLQLN